MESTGFPVFGLFRSVCHFDVISSDAIIHQLYGARVAPAALCLYGRRIQVFRPSSNNSEILDVILLEFIQ